MTIKIRKLDKKDEKSLIDICFITGDLFLKEVFPDPYLFSLFWCLYYVWYETNNSFVAFDTKTKKVIGYILSTLDTKKQEEDFKKTTATLIKNRIKEIKIKSLKTRIIAHFIINKPTSKKQRNLLKRYPAHLHINILLEYQRQGIGHRLMQTLESHLINNNVIGYHLEVGAKNNLGINFYKKYGLELVNKNRFTFTFARDLTCSS
ncbi:MAG: GNAT family N-acetyltransferase [Candidatus Heimdallarchaeota archaeon]